MEGLEGLKDSSQVWEDTQPDDWLFAVRFWNSHIESPLRNWADSNDMQFLSQSREEFHDDVSSLSFTMDFCTLQTYEALSLDVLDIWQKSLEKHGKILYIVTNSFVYTNDRPNIKLLYYPELYGAFALTDVPEYSKDRMLFNCFMRRADAVRQSLLYELHQSSLLPLGFVTYLSINPEWNHQLSPVEIFDTIHKKWLDQNEESPFHKAWQDLRFRVPLQQLDNNISLREHHWASKYSLVSSTHNQDPVVWFNEKEARALQSPSICLPTLLPETIQHLIDLGIKFDFDQSEFSDEPWFIRQKYLINLIKHDKICIPIKKRLDTCHKNINVFSQWKEIILAGQLVSKIIEDLEEQV